MENLFDGLRNAGLSDAEAKLSIEVVYQWVEDRYPILAAVARGMVMKEISYASNDTAGPALNTMVAISEFSN